MSTPSPKWSSLDELLLAIADVHVPEERPVEVNEVGYCGDRPLHVAAGWGDVQAIEMLVAAGAEIDAIGDLGCTALHYAVAQEHVAAARRLIELGASTSIRSEFGSTPAERAHEKGVPGLAELFD